MRVLPILVLLILWVIPTGALASSQIDAGLATVWVDDRFGHSCSHPLPTGCAFDVTQDDGTFQNASVDAYQSIYYIGVATNFSALKKEVGDAWVLPDKSVTFKGETIYLRYPFLRMATEAWQNASRLAPRHDNYSLEMSSDNVTLYYSSVYPSHPTEVRQRNFSLLYARQDQDGVGYEKAGPVHALESDTTDSYGDQVARAMCKWQESNPDCTSTAHGLANLSHDVTPTVQFGLDFYDVEVATDPAALHGPRPGMRAPADPATTRRANQSLALPDDASRPKDSRVLPPVDTSTDPEDHALVSPERGEPSLPPVKTQIARQPTPEKMGVVIAVAATAAGLALLVATLLYSRFASKGDLLHLESRRKLLEIIRQEPGIYVSEAARRMGVTRNTITYHTRMLARMSLIRVVASHGQKTLHMPDALRTVAVARDTHSRLWTHPIRSRIRAALAARPSGLLRQDLHDILHDIPVRTRNHILKGLIEKRVVEEEQDGGETVLRLIG